MIETGRLILRPWREADRARFHAVLNTPAVMADAGGVQPRETIDRMFDLRLEDFARDGFCSLAVTLRETGEIIGTCGLRRPDNYPGTPVDGCVSIGWRIAEGYWRRGYAREAAEACLAWGWANLDTSEITAWTRPGNEPSWRLMERIGMERRPELDFARPNPADPDIRRIVYTMGRPA